MKVLFITNSLGPDYLSDTIFHGGKSIFKNDFFELRRTWYMYDDVQNKGQLYGRGFTLFGKIQTEYFSSIDDNVLELISDKFFDKVIYGSVWRCLDHIKLVTNVYDKKDIILIDGEDHTDIKTDLINKGVYYKREYISKVDGVYPIGFSIPDDLVLDNLTEKTKLVSSIIPNFSWSYDYTNEKDYFDEYAKSWYAITMKKMGWDCLRHYEIMMNGCVPQFKDLDISPKLTLTNLPKKELINMSKYNESNIEFNEFILEYTRNNLTTKHSIEKLLN